MHAASKADTLYITATAYPSITAAETLYTGSCIRQELKGCYCYCWWPRCGCCFYGNRSITMQHTYIANRQRCDIHVDLQRLTTPSWAILVMQRKMYASRQLSTSFRHSRPTKMMRFHRALNWRESLIERESHSTSDTLYRITDQNIEAVNINNINTNTVNRLSDKNATANLLNIHAHLFPAAVIKKQQFLSNISKFHQSALRSYK